MDLGLPLVVDCSTADAVGAGGLNCLSLLSASLPLGMRFSRCSVHARLPCLSTVIFVPPWLSNAYELVVAHGILCWLSPSGSGSAKIASSRYYIEPSTESSSSIEYCSTGICSTGALQDCFWARYCACSRAFRARSFNSAPISVRILAFSLVFFLTHAFLGTRSGLYADIY